MKRYFLICFILTVFILSSCALFSDNDNSVNNSPSYPGEIGFTEILSCNNSLPDFDGHYYGYVEIGNNSSHNISLSGYRIVCDDDVFSFSNDTVLNPGEYRAFWFLKDITFEISSRTNSLLLLYDNNNLVVDRYLISAYDPVIYEHVVNSWKPAEFPSPGFKNTESGREQFASTRIHESVTVYVSEIAADPYSYAVDDNGMLSDYIELYNYGSEPVNLNHFSISDDPDNLFKYVFGDLVIGPGEYKVLYANKKDLPFKLSKTDGYVAFCYPYGILIDEIRYDDLTGGKSLYRSEYSGSYEISEYITPGNSYDSYQSIISSFESGIGIAINEVIVSNNNRFPCATGYYDIIELKNITNYSINLREYSVSDSVSYPDKCILPDIALSPGECFLVYCSGNAILTDERNFHAPFKLSSKSETVYLFKQSTKGYEFEDGVYVSGVPVDYSYGRQESRLGFYYISEPNPGRSINNPGLKYVLDAPEVSVAPGKYDNIEKLEIELTGKGTVYYTLDGTLPDVYSSIYDSSIVVDSSTVIRAFCSDEGYVDSPVVTYNYIVNEHDSLPVLCISCDGDLLFSKEKGICYIGPSDGEGNYPYANVKKDMEAPINLSLIENDGTGFNIDCGLKMFGQSVRYLDKQSFQVKFRAKYGTKNLEYDLFDNGQTDYKCFVIRSGSQDYRRSMFRDELCTSLASELLLVQDFKPCVLYINGEYYGIYWIKEKIDENFIASHLDVEPESVDLLVGNGNVIYGSKSDWYSLLSYVKNHNMTKEECYSYVCDRIDVVNFTDYIISEAFFGNRDSGNIKFYRSNQTDNKWRWILYDLDYGMSETLSYGIWFMIDPEGTGYAHRYSTVLINGLLKNESYRKLFYERLAYCLDHVYTQERITEAIDGFISVIGADINKNINRWGKSYSNWTYQVSLMRDFISTHNNRGKTRKMQMLDEAYRLFELTPEDMQTYFGVSGYTPKTVKNSDPEIQSEQEEELVKVEEIQRVEEVTDITQMSPTDIITVWTEAVKVGDTDLINWIDISDYYNILIANTESVLFSEMDRGMENAVIRQCSVADLFETVSLLELDGFDPESVYELTFEYSKDSVYYNRKFKYVDAQNVFSDTVAEILSSEFLTENGLYSGKLYFYLLYNDAMNSYQITGISNSFSDMIGYVLKYNETLSAEAAENR